MIPSTAETLLSLLADDLGGVYGLNAHLATLGEALVQVWAKPFKNHDRKYQARAWYRNNRHAFGTELRQLCQYMKRQLERGPAPPEKLRQAAHTLAS